VANPSTFEPSSTFHVLNLIMKSHPMDSSLCSLR